MSLQTPAEVLKTLQTFTASSDVIYFGSAISLNWYTAYSNG